MKRKTGLYVSIGFMLSIVWFGLIVRAGRCQLPPSLERDYTRSRHVRYSFTLQNTTGKVLPQAELWVYAPVQHTATQYTTHIDSSHPFKHLSDNFANTFLHFTLHRFPPYTTKIVMIQTQLLLSESPLPLPDVDPKRYLQPERYCESDDPAIIRLAEQLRAETSDRTAENIFRWVSANVRYTGYLKQPRGARYALNYKQGDCTEFMYLFMALCRAVGIPAHAMGGYVITKNAVLKPEDYHNWAEFYVDGVWHLADPQRKIFMQAQSSYLAMRIIGPTSENHPMQHYRRFRYTGQGLKVTMN